MKTNTFSKTQTLVLAALCALALTGCARVIDRFTPSGPADVELERPNDSCDSAQYRRYIGQSADALYDLVMVGPVRMISPGAAVTMDHNPVRLNFELDVNGEISGIWCG